MSDDTTKRDERDRSRVAGGEDYEVRYFAEQHGLSPDDVRALIARVGNDRTALEAEVRKRGSST